MSFIEGSSRGNPIMNRPYTAREYIELMGDNFGLRGPSCDGCPTCRCDDDCRECSGDLSNLLESPCAFAPQTPYSGRDTCHTELFELLKDLATAAVSAVPSVAAQTQASNCLQFMENKVTGLKITIAATSIDGINPAIPLTIPVTISEGGGVQHDDDEGNTTLLILEL